MQRAPLVALVLGLVAVGCDQPPAKEVAAAEAALAAAEQEGATQYASDRLAAAREALADAQRRVAAKDYRGGLSAANEAAEKARAAAKTAEAAKRLAQSDAELARDEARIALEEIPTLKSEATGAHVPDEAFAEVETQLSAVQALLTSVDERIAARDFLSAQKAGEEARAQARLLPESYRQARTAWEEAHPKRGKGRAKAANRSTKR
jgi:colicin import membrane protein